MTDKINELLRRVEEFKPKAAADVEEFRIKILGKKGELNALLEEFKGVAPELKRELGQKINHLKSVATERINALRSQMQQQAADAPACEDMSRPGSAERLGSRHPIALVKNQIVEVFSRLGYTVAEGPEIEDDWHVFSALNFPPEHPARDMQDTFYLSEEFLLRTQTSGGQIRTMDVQKPPIKILMPGRVFRSDSDATHSPMFHQMEGLVVDKGITLGDLQGALNTFVQKLFGADTRTRLRPSYFPFTEPSVEVDVSCFECHGKGCPLCKHSGWIEVLGAGVVHRSVLENCGIDPEVYSGFAFGIGIERIAMLKYGINNIGLMFENNLQFLKQFHE